MQRMVGLVAFALATFPQLGASQLVLRDDTAGWGWLALVTDRRAVVQLAYASQENDQGSLDAELLETMRGRGVRRLFGHESFDPAESQVIAECTGTDWTPEGSEQTFRCVHTDRRVLSGEFTSLPAVGSQVSVRYLPEDPRRAVIARLVSRFTH